MISIEQDDADNKLALHVDLAKRSVGTAEHRWAVRHTVNKPVFLIDDIGGRSMPCVLRNTSESGALLDFPPAPISGYPPIVKIGDRLTIVVLDLDKSDVAEVEVVRTAGSQIGVRYRTSYETFTAALKSGR